MAKTEKENQVLSMADSKNPGKITDLNTMRHCAECGCEHKLYQPCTVKSTHVQLRQENERLSKRCEQLEQLEGMRVVIYTTLVWMIIALEFTNENTGMHAEDSPEMKEAKLLRDKLKPESDVK